MPESDARSVISTHCPSLAFLHVPPNSARICQLRHWKGHYLSPRSRPPMCDPVWPSGKALSGRTWVRYRFGSPFSSKRLWFVHTVLWLCPSLPTETLKWLSSLPILMQKSFWWWQCSDRFIISLSPHHTLPHLLPVRNCKPYGFCGR